MQGGGGGGGEGGGKFGMTAMAKHKNEYISLFIYFLLYYICHSQIISQCKMVTNWENEKR
jgi:hypothetical protein